MFSDLKNKKVLVTGASSGIGACTGELFAHYGAVVGVHYHTNKEGANQVVSRIRAKDGRAYMLYADFRNNKKSQSLVQKFIEQTGGIDILVNNAGAIFGTGHFLNMDIKDWDATINLNMTAPFLLGRSAFVFMMKNGGGKIINISSISSKYGGSESSIHYGAAKAGLDAITRTMARTGAPYNILVNSIQPGVIDTEAHKKIGRTSLNERIQRIPLKRPGTPLDVARLCVFLGSDCGNYITGQVFGVTGGD